VYAPEAVDPVLWCCPAGGKAASPPPPLPPERLLMPRRVLDAACWGFSSQCDAGKKQCKADDASEFTTPPPPPQLPLRV